MAKVGAGGSAAAPSSRGPCACILATPRDRAASPARTFFFGWLCSSGIAARPLCVRCLSPFALLVHVPVRVQPELRVASFSPSR